MKTPLYYAVAWSLASVCVYSSAQDVAVSSATAGVLAPAVDREVRVDLGSSVSTPEAIRDGLFPEDAESAQQRQERERCERLIAEGFKCMPPVRSYTRFNLPGMTFRVGSAELPDLMKQQLQSFADALRGKSGSAGVVRIEGHADATGNAQGNLALSQQRAESVRDFLVSLGVDAGLLRVEGFGSAQLRNPSDPSGAENRRVEIARALKK